MFKGYVIAGHGIRLRGFASVFQRVRVVPYMKRALNGVPLHVARLAYRNAGALDKADSLFELFENNCWGAWVWLLAL